MSDDIDVPELSYEIETPSFQERVFFLGSNGSGKTIAASQLIRSYTRVYILDVKYDFPIPWKKGDYQIRTTPPGVGFWNTLSWRFGSKHIIYRPKPPYDNGREISEWLDWLFHLARQSGKKHPFIVYLDEGMWSAYNGAKIAISRLAITGRSIGIGLWIASQRPKGIPVEVRSEAWRFFVFFLRHRDDRKEICNVLDDAITEDKLATTTLNYQFWEIKREEGGQQSFRLMPPIAYKKGKES